MLNKIMHVISFANIPGIFPGRFLCSNLGSLKAITTTKNITHKDFENSILEYFSQIFILFYFFFKFRRIVDIFINYPSLNLFCASAKVVSRSHVYVRSFPNYMTTCAVLFCQRGYLYYILTARFWR